MRLGELCLKSLNGIDMAVTLSPQDVSVDNITNPQLLKIHLKVSKTDPFQEDADIHSSNEGWFTYVPCRQLIYITHLNYCWCIYCYAIFIIIFGTIFCPIWVNADHHYASLHQLYWQWSWHCSMFCNLFMPKIWETKRHDTKGACVCACVRARSRTYNLSILPICNNPRTTFKNTSPYTHLHTEHTHIKQKESKVFDCGHIYPLQ